MKLEDIFDFIKSCRYGNSEDGTLDWQNYLSASPEKFASCKRGICIDYAEYVLVSLCKEGFVVDPALLGNKTATLMLLVSISNNGKIKVHAFPVIKTNTFVVIEGSWKDIEGVKKFDSLKELLDYYIQQHERVYENLTSHQIYSYKPGNYGLGFREYLESAMKSGIRVI